MKFRSFGSVAAGVAANFLAVPVDLVLQAAHFYPSSPAEFTDALCAVALAYRAVFAVLGGWTTARLAPSSPMRHAWALAGLGVLLSSFGALANWNLGHHWYPLTLIALSLPATWAGAQIQIRS